MKKITLLTALIIYSLIGFSQSPSSCMIAHWDMDSTTNDVSGNGNNGTGHALTPAIGEDGVMGHAYYFNGDSSYIWVPYDSTFNVKAYTIVATLQVMGYYSGDCQINMILGRGKTGTGIATYAAFFSCQPNDGASCTYFDSTTENFEQETGDFSPASVAGFSYTPYIVDNKWYTVVETFNDTVYKIYVNDTLKSTLAVLTPGSSHWNTSTDGINIGLNTFEPAFPYGFKGVIDDVQLYSCVLSDSVIGTLGVKNNINQLSDDVVSVYPNPSNNIFNIHLPNGNFTGSIQLFNQLGQIVEEKNIVGNTTQMNVEHLPVGIYFIKIEAGTQTIYKKVLKY